MRSLFARLALIGTVGALAGCGTTNGSSLPLGAFPNGSGGGPVPVANQGPAPGTIPGKSIDGGLLAVDGRYTGFNTAATDTQSAVENGTDTANAAALPPKDPGTGQANGSHLITFAGSGQPQIELLFNNLAPINLTVSTPLPGQIQPVNYGAIVLFAKTTAGATAPAAGAPSVNIELTGGVGTTAFDTRIACAAKAATTATPAPGTPTPAFTRYVCPLPAYGATVTQPAENAVSPSATSGTFTPTSVKLYVVLQYAAATLTTSTGNTLALDTIYAEQGTN